MREPLFVVERFVQHYRALGAEKIVIIWDGFPEKDFREQLEALGSKPFLELIYGDEAMWAAHGIDAKTATLDGMQAAGFQLGYAACDTDWVLICDADEYLYSPNTMEAFFSEVPNDVLSVRVRNTEAVWGPEDDISEPFGCGYFRFRIEMGPFTKALTWCLHGRLGSISRGGMIGHSGGKHLLRSGLANVKIGSHFSQIGGKAISVWAHDISPALHPTFIAHYDVISEERWVEKWRRRISGERAPDKMSPARLKQQNMVRDAIENETTRALFQKLYGLTPWQRFLLKVLGCLRSAKPMSTAAPAPMQQHHISRTSVNFDNAG